MTDELDKMVADIVDPRGREKKQEDENEALIKKHTRTCPACRKLLDKHLTECPWCESLSPPAHIQSKLGKPSP